MRKIIDEIIEYKAAPLENVNLAMNENHHINWSDKLPSAAQTSANSYNYSAYGDNQFSRLKDVYADYLGVQPNQVLPFSGSESAIGILMNALAEKNILLLEPDFFRFKELANIHRKNVFTVDIREGINEDAIIQSMIENDIDFCIFSNPNNPLGITLPFTLVERMVNETNAYIVSDEAYIEFGGESAISLLTQSNRVLVMRTTSKAWGLAGMRIGFVVGNADVITYLRKAVGPFHINTLTTEIVAAALNQEAYMLDVVKEIKALRDEWSEKLVQKYGMEVYPSSTNFINAKVDDAEKIWKFLADHQVNVSKFPPSNLRISIGTPGEMAVLEETLDAYVNLEEK